MGEARVETTRQRPVGGGHSQRGGFTLTELLVVIGIIGIIITFILMAAQDARRRAEEAATQSLIAKLEAGLNDRLDALLQTRPDYNAAHYYLAGIYHTASAAPLTGANARAQVIAWYDFIKSEMPDVFFVQNTTGPYPLNFAANPYPGSTTIDANGLGYFILPLGNSIANNPAGNDYGADNYSNTVGTGIYGASYFAAAGIYKNLGYLPAGYDGVDNNGNGAIDEWAEGVNDPPNYTSPNATALAQVQANLAAHKHHTARSETLYAILVEGVGPLGSVFSRDDFTDKEVQDTDGDGLPEFVDAWCQPLQFFRWPLLYHSDSQKGQVIVDDVTTGLPTLIAPYLSPFETREQNPLDPNQQLMAPGWWSSTQNLGFPPAIAGTAVAVGGSGSVNAFEFFFHRLTEPLANPGGTPGANTYWDRNGTIYPSGPYGYRRAFFSRPLIVSSGPDEQMGIFHFPDSSPPSASQLVMIENNASPFGWHPPAGPFTLDADFTSVSTISPGPIPAASSSDPNFPTSQDLRERGHDDISNQNRQAVGGTGGS